MRDEAVRSVRGEAGDRWLPLTILSASVLQAVFLLATGRLLAPTARRPKRSGAAWSSSISSSPFPTTVGIRAFALRPCFARDRGAIAMTVDSAGGTAFGSGVLIERASFQLGMGYTEGRGIDALHRMSTPGMRNSRLSAVHNRASCTSCKTTKRTRRRPAGVYRIPNRRVSPALHAVLRLA